MGAIGLFTYADNLLDAAERMKNSGYSITLFSPVPLEHEIAHTHPTLGERKNHVKYLTVAGSIMGFFAGIILTFGTAALYVLPRGGRPIFSLTPTLLISYETAILGGVFMSLFGFFVFSKLPSYRKKVYVPEVAVDSFGLFVENILAEKFDDVEKLMKEYGASEVKKVDE